MQSCSSLQSMCYLSAADVISGIKGFRTSTAQRATQNLLKEKQETFCLTPASEK